MYSRKEFSHHVQVILVFCNIAAQNKFKVILQISKLRLKDVNWRVYKKHI